MNFASIDIGSNTVLLLIAEVKNNNLHPLVNMYRSPRISKGLRPGREILKDRIDALTDILSEYKNIIEEYNCTKIIITATNAMRIASNSQIIINMIKEKLDLDIKVIAGEDEAHLSFLGASSSFPDIENKIVIDIGGGSTEIVYGNKTNIKYIKSFQTGVVSLTENYLSALPYEDHDLKLVDKHLEEIFRPISDNIPKNIPIIAVAGTPTTLSCMHQGLRKYDEVKVECSILSEEDLEQLYDRLRILPGKAILKKFGQVVDGREDVLFSGLLILKYLMRATNNTMINVSGRGLRYGSIIDYIK